ncbi:MAG: cell wall-binding repeat-containing protein [Catenulispora sp.]
MLPITTAHAAGNLYVVNGDSSACSPTGPGSSAAPFCTLADAVAAPALGPGDTIQMLGHWHDTGPVTLAKSGAAGSPITIDATRAVISGNAVPLSLSGVSHVSVKGLAAYAESLNQPFIRVDGSDDIHLDGIIASGNGGAPGIELHNTKDSTVSGGQMRLASSPDFTGAAAAAGILIDGGSSGIRVENVVSYYEFGTVVSVFDSTGTTIVNNTLDEACASAIDIEGASSGTVVKNDIVTNSGDQWCGDPDFGSGLTAAVTVAGSAGDTVFDHNLLFSDGFNGSAVGAAVSWGGTVYQTVGDLDAAQLGSNDIGSDPRYVNVGGNTLTLTYDSPAINAADSSVLPSTDADGQPRPILDPAYTPVGGTANGDLGAYEFKAGPLRVNASYTTGRTPSDYRKVTVSVTGSPSWWPIADYKVDFGNGVVQQSKTAKSFTYTYPADGPVTITAYAEDGHSTPAGQTFHFTIAPTDYKPQLIVTPEGDQGKVHVASYEDHRSYTLDMGDGHTFQGTGPLQPDYFYQRSGTYTVSLTATNADGWTGTTTTTVSITVAGSTPPPPPPSARTLTRIWGADRYRTAVAVSASAWGPGSTTAVVLARGDDFADALTGGPLAARVHGPLLLTDPAVLGSQTWDEIKRVLGGPGNGKTIYILGGTAAVSPNIEHELTSLGYKTMRYAGPDRYATALTVAQKAFPDAQGAVVAVGDVYADALAAGPLAARLNQPMLLTGRTDVDPATWTWLQAHPHDSISGMPAWSAILNHGYKLGRLGAALDDAHRYLGKDRYATAVAIAQAMIDPASSVNPNPVPGSTPTNQLCFASGEAFPDALSGGALCAVQGYPLMLVPADGSSNDVNSAVSRWGSRITQARLFGGTKAVSQHAEDQIAASGAFFEG